VGKVNRRHLAALLLTLAILSVGVCTWLRFPWWAELVIVLALGIYALLEWYEHFAADAKHIALVATLSALGAVGRTAVQGVPGVQPATFLVIASGYAFGPVVGAAVGVFTAVGSDLFLGEGGWTPWHVVAWGLAGITSGLLRHVVNRYSKSLMAVYGIVWGYLFGWIMNTWLLLGGTAVSFHTYWLLCIASFWFDTLHAVTTGALLLLIGKQVDTVLTRFRKRMTVTRVSA
jgi:energy-coupling factor transport system substrate-specific component